jgi:hypothetical protein
MNSNDPDMEAMQANQPNQANQPEPGNEALPVEQNGEARQQRQQNNNNGPRQRMKELMAIPERERTDAQWDELNELEISMASANRDNGQGQNPGQSQQPRRDGQGQRPAGGNQPRGGGGGGGGRQGKKSFKQARNRQAGPRKPGP